MPLRKKDFLIALSVQWVHPFWARTHDLLKCIVSWKMWPTSAAILGPHVWPEFSKYQCRSLRDRFYEISTSNGNIFWGVSYQSSTSRHAQ
jgi:hypothetical protein